MTCDAELVKIVSYMRPVEHRESQKASRCASKSAGVRALGGTIAMGNGDDAR